MRCWIGVRGAWVSPYNECAQRTKATVRANPKRLRVRGPVSFITCLTRPMDAATTFYGDVAETARALRFYHLHFKYLLNSFHRKNSREILTIASRPVSGTDLIDGNFRFRFRGPSMAPCGQSDRRARLPCGIEPQFRHSAPNQDSSRAAAVLSASVRSTQERLRRRPNC